jgi:hypothetical protein
MDEVMRSMDKEVERREIELEAWRERYVSVKKSYEEQLCTPFPHPPDSQPKPKSSEI